MELNWTKQDVETHYGGPGLAEKWLRELCLDWLTMHAEIERLEAELATEEPNLDVTLREFIASFAKQPGVQEEVRGE